MLVSVGVDVKDVPSLLIGVAQLAHSTETNIIASKRKINCVFINFRDNPSTTKIEKSKPNSDKHDCEFQTPISETSELQKKRFTRSAEL